jgi:hypothetical protein
MTTSLRIHWCECAWMTWMDSHVTLECNQHLLETFVPLIVRVSFFKHYKTFIGLIPVAEGSNATVYGSSLTGTAASNPVWLTAVCLFFEFCVLSCRSLCDGPITRPEESYRLWYALMCDLETLRMRRLWAALGCWARKSSSQTLNYHHKFK